MDSPTFILTLLSGNWLFFNDDEIAWDGDHHVITGIQVNGAQVDQFMDFVNTYMSDFDDIQDVVNYFLTFLGEAEKDEGLIVPRASIAPGIQKAIRQGDLTGTTLANLAACGAAFQVKLQAEDSYVVIYDTRLGIGIPSFYNLIARLLWDFRQGLNSKKGVPFNVIFMGARNFDANEYIDDVPKSVVGAQDNPGAMQVNSCPETHLDHANSGIGDESDGLASCFAPFHSGFDDPTETQADEELFDASLQSLARSFPMTVAIEGTHVHGRAERIESVKMGDSLTLASDWQTEFFNPVGIEVFNEAGETLGYLNEQFSPSLSGSRELACLLPFITATVESVTPLSQRRKNARHALMDIRLDLDSDLVPNEWDMSINASALKAIKELLSRPKPQRVVLSHTNLSPRQLKGSVDTSDAMDEAYGSIAIAPRAHSDVANLSGNEEDREPSEREQIISLLQLFVLTGQMSGTQFPQDLIDRLEKAAEGDESIDVEELAEQLNSAAPQIKTTDFNNTTFSQDRRVDGRKFSIAVPDGWTILKDVEEGGLFSNIVRPFVIVSQEVNEGDDISLSDRIMYSSLGGDTEVEEGMKEYGIPAMKWALLFYNTYSKTDELGAMKPPFIWDDEVDALNTKCFVGITDPENSSNGLDCYIYPYALDHSDFLRGTFNYDETVDLEQVKNLVIQIAQSIKLDNPLQTSCELMLEKALQERVTADEFSEMTFSFAKPFIVLRQMVFDSAQQKYFSQGENLTPKAILLAGARGIVEFTARAIPILAKLLDAFDKQVGLGAIEDDLSKMVDSINTFDTAVFPIVNLFSEEPDSVALIESAGVFSPSLDLQKLRSRIATLTSGNDCIQSQEADSRNSGQKSAARVNSEEFKLDALPMIAEAFNRRISADEYVAICEAVGFGFMQKRQEACNSAASSFSSDEDNVTAMSREFGRFNPIIARYIEYLLDLIDVQIELGATDEESKPMAMEVEELLSLISDSFSCGNPYLDSIANSNAPVSLPNNFDALKLRIASLRG